MINALLTALAPAVTDMLLATLVCGVTAIAVTVDISVALAAAIGWLRGRWHG